MELAALKAKREKVALVAPLLLMGIGVVAAAQGAAFIVINDNSSFPSDGLKTVGIVFIAGGATAFIAGAALLPVRLSKRRSLDRQIKALESPSEKPTVSFAPFFAPGTSSTAALFGAAMTGSF